ncbi:hypothetical protein ACA910_012203 [Epithemia clementina (nom. ined.)]
MNTTSASSSSPSFAPNHETAGGFNTSSGQHPVTTAGTIIRGSQSFLSRASVAGSEEYKTPLSLSKRARYDSNRTPSSVHSSTLDIDLASALFHGTTGPFGFFEDESALPRSTRSHDGISGNVLSGVELSPVVGIISTPRNASVVPLTVTSSSGLSHRRSANTTHALAQRSTGSFSWLEKQLDFELCKQNPRETDAVFQTVVEKKQLPKANFDSKQRAKAGNRCKSDVWQTKKEKLSLSISHGKNKKNHSPSSAGASHFINAKGSTGWPGAGESKDFVTSLSRCDFSIGQSEYSDHRHHDSSDTETEEEEEDEELRKWVSVEQSMPLSQGVWDAPVSRTQTLVGPRKETSGLLADRKEVDLESAERESSPVAEDRLAYEVAASKAQEEAIVLAQIVIPPFHKTQPDPGRQELDEKLISSASTGPPPDPFTRWSQKEDELLLHAIEKEGGPPVNWRLISKQYFQGRRNENQCKGRWKKHVRPEVKRTAWTKEEDETIVHYQGLGFTWPQIAAKLPGRIPDQVRDRFNNFVDPSLKKEPFTEEERRILFDAQLRLGNKWTAIAKLLPGRSENMVKNCWHNARISQRRKLGRLAQIEDRNKWKKAKLEKKMKTAAKKGTRQYKEDGNETSHKSDSEQELAQSSVSLAIATDTLDASEHPNGLQNDVAFPTTITML